MTVLNQKYIGGLLLIQSFFIGSFSEAYKTRRIIRDECNRQRNSILADKLKLNLSDHELTIPTYEFVENCITGVYGKPISIEKLKDLIP